MLRGVICHASRDFSAYSKTFSPPGAGSLRVAGFPGPPSLPGLLCVIISGTLGVKNSATSWCLKECGSGGGGGGGGGGGSVGRINGKWFGEEFSEASTSQWHMIMSLTRHWLTCYNMLPRVSAWSRPWRVLWCSLWCGNQIRSNERDKETETERRKDRKIEVWKEKKNNHRKTGRPKRRRQREKFHLFRFLLNG